MFCRRAGARDPAFRASAVDVEDNDDDSEQKQWPWSGGRPRCFVYWQEFQKCYAQTDSPRECTPSANDYLECLHKPKETARAHAIEKEYLRAVQRATKENKKSSDALADSVIVGVGLINREGTDKA
ncbi:hypothetical protein FA15DRAFT_270976 [Coprinopsis marcescibilis]|uniref:NADH dehydrogenase [ubiquinone] iron-sulfur protein 5 n=1 Tax=Coprinopsis marcescibilis TaxID=230819 RepID=A0A5C3L1H8_COPMA|nr:hypothetical protein FA15DRAFT_270976 [Coprinopsis marcescibilis]